MSPVLVVVLVAVAGALPSVLYAYFARWSRDRWNEPVTPGALQRPPVPVRIAAWTGFALALLALPSLAIVGVCGLLFLLQLESSDGTPAALAALLVMGAAAAAQLYLAWRHVVFGVALLGRDRDLLAGRWRGVVASVGVNTAALAAAAASYAYAARGSWMNGYLQLAFLVYAVLPVSALALLLLAHALLLNHAARAEARWAAPPA